METENNNKKVRKRLPLLILSATLLTIGNCGGPLIMRLYFLHGGKRLWLSSWLETGAWPVIFAPLLLSYLHRRRRYGPTAKPYFMDTSIFLSATVIGILTGFDDYFYAYGVSRLPVSTLSLIIASHLAFTAFFAYLLVKHKFTSYSVNAIVLLTLGAVVLALHSSGDRPKGESSKDYYLGFVMTVAAAMLYGLVLPMVERTYKRAKQVVTYTLVLEIQLVMCFFATVVCTVGMAANNDFKVIPREAKQFGLGETKYYLVLVCSGIFWQCWFLGAIGVIFSGSSLLSAVIIASLLPITEILAVIFYKEKFQTEKGVSLVLSLWGFISYFYGEMKQNKKNEKNSSKRADQERETTEISRIA